MHFKSDLEPRWDARPLININFHSSPQQKQKARDCAMCEFMRAVLHFGSWINQRKGNWIIPQIIWKVIFQSQNKACLTFSWHPWPMLSRDVAKWSDWCILLQPLSLRVNKRFFNRYKYIFNCEFYLKKTFLRSVLANWIIGHVCQNSIK